MKVAVVGLGSMGQRRTRLIKQYDSSIEVFGIDTMPERCAECQEKYGMKTFASIPDLVAAEPEVSCIFISTGPLSHNPIIKECIKYGLHVFTEINLVADGYEENIAAAKEKGVKLFLSSTFLYRDEVAYIKKACNAAKQGKLNYIYHIGQYLPNWHPWEDYRKVFYANPRTNGCREIMAIDMPWILDIFGPVKKFSAMKSKNTDLDIAFNDNVYIMMEHENGNKGVFVCDVVTPKTERDFEVYGENFFLSWDGSAFNFPKRRKPRTAATLPRPKVQFHFEKSGLNRFFKIFQFFFERGRFSSVKKIQPLLRPCPKVILIFSASSTG